MEPTSHLTVDLAGVASNVAALRRRMPVRTVVCGVVKSNGYGLGATAIARSLEAGGARLLAVYDLDEAAELLESGLRQPILVLGPETGGTWAAPLRAAARDGRLHATIHGLRQIHTLARTARRIGRPLPVHLEIDTGMARGGCEPESAPTLLARIAETPSLRLAGVFTHLCDGTDDAGIDEQLARFDAALTAGPPRGRTCLVHVANSAAVLRRPELARDAVRVGQAWAGFGPGAPDAGLCRTVRWTSRLVHVRDLAAGSSVGYGRQWHASGPTRLGLVPVGYADGLPRSLAGTDAEGIRARVRMLPAAPVRSVRSDRPSTATPGGGWAPIVGAVSMDQITIDLTGLPASMTAPGTQVEIVGTDPDAPNDLAALADAAGTTHYELLCRLGPRVGRRWACGPGAGAGAEGLGAGSTASATVPTGTASVGPDRATIRGPWAAGARGADRPAGWRGRRPSRARGHHDDAVSAEGPRPVLVRPERPEVPEDSSENPAASDSS